MSWKAFSLRRKPNTPSLPELIHADERGKSLKRGDKKRIMLMNMVKEGKLSVDNAMQKAYGMGIASVPYEQMDIEEETQSAHTSSTDEIYNFGVYKYGKNNKSVKCVLQVDCQEECLCLLQRGQKQKSYPFVSIKNVDAADDATSLFIQFDDATEIEIDAGTYEEKNRIARLLRMILGQLSFGENLHDDSFAQRKNKLLKEGMLEKKGRSAAFLVWPKRYVRIFQGEFMYFKPGDEANESSALSIITLKNDIFIKKLEDNGFVLVTDKKEYTFRVFGHRQVGACEKERDDWILAIQEASKPLHILNENEENGSENPFQQEQYLKTVVCSLNEELEQLGVMLNIIDAPIRASTQVRKVREIVHSLNNQIHTGLLSWTLRNATHGNDDTNTSTIQQESLPSLPEMPTKIEKVMPNYYNQQYYPNVQNSNLYEESYSHLGGPHKIKQHGTNRAEEGYNMLNLTGVQEGGNGLEQPTFPIYSPYAEHSSNGSTVHQKGNQLDKAVFPRYIPHPEHSSSGPSPPHDDYAKIAKVKSKDARPYYNLQTNYFKEGNNAPPLPPKLSEQDMACFTPENSDNLYQKHDIKLKIDPSKQAQQEETIKLEVAEKDVGKSGDNYVPPPPPMPGSIPPPPPLGGLVASILPHKEDKTPNCKMKPLFWTKVPDMQINASIWKDAEDRVDIFNIKKMEKLFFLEQQQKQDVLKNQIDANKDVKTTKKSLLDPRKAQNFGIFLSGFKLNDTDIESKLSVLDENSGLSSEQITALKRFQPTTEEMEMYKSFKGNKKDLPSVDQFMLTLCAIPQLSSRLDVLLTIRDLPDLYNGIELPIANLLSACASLRDNKTFIRLLEYVLSVGNYLNGGTNRGRAYGFKLSALVKLVDIRSADKKHTMLQYIAEELYELDQECLFCYKDMTSLLLPTDASIKGLIAEVEIMNKDLAKVARQIKVLSPTSNSEFVEGVEDFIKEYSNKTETLEIQCKDILSISLALKQRFGESTSTDFQTWLNHVSDFMKQLQRAAEDVEQKHRRLTNRQTQMEQHATVSKTDQAFKDDLNVTLSAKKEMASEEKSVAPLVKDIEIIYDRVTTHTTRVNEEDIPKISEERPSALNRVPTKVFTLKKATVIESTHISTDYESDDDELSFPIKSGYLEKLSGGKKRNPKWDRRFFDVTAAGYLHYAKKRDGKLSGAIYLRGLPVDINPNDSCSLVIHQQDRYWKLRADNELDILDWYNVLIYYSQMDEIEV